MKSIYYSHLRLTVREVSKEELECTKFFGRWRRASQVFALPT